MNPAVVISPHLDDAVLSLGRFLAGRPDAIVVTVCAGVPDEDVPVTTYDEACGFGSGAEAMRARRVEDAAALRALRAEPRWLPCLDSQYDGSPAHLEAFFGFLAEPLPPGCDTVLVPLGVKHPDHLAVAEVVRAVAIERWVAQGAGVWVYEELPGRVLWPESAWASLNHWRHALDLYDLDAEVGFVGTGSKTSKRAALAKYRSQRKALEVVEGWEVAIHCPERVWRITA